MIIESCCTTRDAALAAQARGTDRIEFCVDLSVGGVTPPRDLIREVVQALTIPVNVLIRPSPRTAILATDFVYDETMLQQMISDIGFCRSVGVAGIVVGALTPEGLIDLPALKRLLSAACPLPITFHRAFDVCKEDPFEALERLIALGFTRLLTSGMAENAWAGRTLIAALVKKAGNRIIVMPGRGITPGNLAALAAVTRATEFHGTAIP